jgi:hypothetical protein
VGDPHGSSYREIAPPVTPPVMKGPREGEPLKGKNKKSIIIRVEHRESNVLP